VVLPGLAAAAKKQRARHDGYTLSDGLRTANLAAPAEDGADTGRGADSVDTVAACREFRC
jgi:hypothetical protein